VRVEAVPLLKTLIKVLPNNILLGIVTVTHLGYVANCNLRAIDDLDRQLVQVVDTRRKSVDVDRVLERAKLSRAAGKDERLVVDRGRDIALRQVFFLKFSRIEINRDKSRLATERIRNRDARNADQANPNLIERDVESLLFGKRGAPYAVLQNGNGGGVVLDDEWWRSAWWELS